MRIRYFIGAFLCFEIALVGIISLMIVVTYPERGLLRSVIYAQVAVAGVFAFLGLFTLGISQLLNGLDIEP